MNTGWTDINGSFDISYRYEISVWWTELLVVVFSWHLTEEGEKNRHAQQTTAAPTQLFWSTIRGHWKSKGLVKKEP